MKKWYGLTLLPLFEKLNQNEKKYGLNPLSLFEKLNQNETSMD